MDTLPSPFLTDLDSRAKVKGSRDALGIQQIWVRLGRHVVGNLTTVSSSVRDFSTLLLGYYFAQRVADDLGPGTELATFIKWEQLASYARASVNKEKGFRGTERVWKALAERSRVTLSDDRRHQTLSNQKTYGLWGLYTVPARASGLLDGDPARLTPPARELVEEAYLPLLAKGAGRDAERIVGLLRPPSKSIDLERGEAAVAAAIAHVLRPQVTAEEQVFYRTHLLYGGPQDATDGRQRQLAQLLAGTLDQPEFAWSVPAVADLSKAAKQHGEGWDPLAHRLDRIRCCETVLAPVSDLFTHLLAKGGKAIGAIAKEIEDAWGSKGVRTIDPQAFAELRGEIAAGDTANGDRWVAIAEATARGEYGHLIELLLAQNKAVMAARGGLPWLELQSGRLHVRTQAEHGDLPRRDALASLWRFPYFLDSLRSVAWQLSGG
jgi:hypothetical protein